MHPYHAATVTGFGLATAGTGLLAFQQPALAVTLTAGAAGSCFLYFAMRVRP